MDKVVIHMVGRECDIVESEKKIKATVLLNINVFWKADCGAYQNC